MQRAATLTTLVILDRREKGEGRRDKGEERREPVPVVGAVVDSPVDYEGVSRGIALATTNHPVAQAVISNVTSFYLKLREKKNHQAASHAFHEMAVPSSLWVSVSVY